MELTDEKTKIVNLTNSAKEELIKLLQKEANNPEGVRLSLLAGGCSGLSYNMEFGKQKENDSVDEYGEIKIFIDPKSALYINGIVLDYQGGLSGRGFVFDNPNAKKSCGCGTSFSVDDKNVTLEFAGNKKPTNVCPSTPST